MVVLSAGMVTKAGNPVFSRQFVDMPRMRVEGLYSSFLQLIDKSSQHTYIETETIRYLYLPVETLYLVVITTKNSNMMEDLETIRLMSRCIPEACGVDTVTEERIIDCSFELVFAFDEVIAPHGYKENLTIQAVKTSLEMDSNEERIAIALRKQKEAEAKEEVKRRQADIQRQRKDREAQQRRGGGGGIGGGGSGVGGGGMGGDSHYDTPVIQKTAPAPAPQRARAGGMKLGRKPQASSDDLMDQMMKEGGIAPSGGGPKRSAGGGAPASAAAASGVTLHVQETVDLELNKDGGLERMEVKGDLTLEVADQESACCAIRLDMGANDGFQFKTHPNVDKQRYAGESVIGLKVPDKPFPLNSALGVLRWRFVSKDEGDVPLTINCWPSQSGDLSYVNIEYELTQAKFELTDVCISIPLGGAADSIDVQQIDGEYKVDRRNDVMHWTLDMIDASNASGTFEFTVPVCSSGVFFPVNVNFGSTKTFCDVAVDAVEHASQGSPLKYQSNSNLTVGQYVIE
eukprot:COSAG05_NODE_59_length_23169_cov_37.393698_6_plen_515_part_00